jgi:hypothetical protein
MSSAQKAKRDAGFAVPEFVSTFGTSLKPRTSQPFLQTGNNQSDTNLSGGSPLQKHAASPASSASALNSMQVLPSSPLKQALDKTQRTFGSRAALSDPSPQSKNAIEVPEFISTYPKSFKSKSSVQQRDHNSPAAASAVVPEIRSAHSAPSSDALIEAGIFEALIESLEKPESPKPLNGNVLLALSASDSACQVSNDVAAPLLSTAEVDSKVKLRDSIGDSGTDQHIRKREKRKKKKSAAAACAPPNVPCDSVCISGATPQPGDQNSDCCAAGVQTHEQTSLQLPQHQALALHSKSPSQSSSPAATMHHQVDAVCESSSSPALQTKAKASWWRQSQLRRFVLRLPQQRNFSCQFESAVSDASAGTIQQLQQQLKDALHAHAAAVSEAKVLSEALLRHHESSSRELQLSENSTRALTSHVATLQAQLQAMRSCRDSGDLERSSMAKSVAVLQSQIDRLQHVDEERVAALQMQRQQAEEIESMRLTNTKLEIELSRIQETNQRLTTELAAAHERVQTACESAAVAAAARDDAKKSEEALAVQLSCAVQKVVANLHEPFFIF